VDANRRGPGHNHLDHILGPVRDQFQHIEANFCHRTGQFADIFGCVAQAGNERPTPSLAQSRKLALEPLVSSKVGPAFGVEQASAPRNRGFSQTNAEMGLYLSFRAIAS